MSRIILTCGPATAPLDEVRRITNHSTGHLGIHLANVLTEAGFSVECLIGSGRTCATPLLCERVDWFHTNDDLFKLLQAASLRGPATAVLHAAALSDYTVESITNGAGKSLSGGKIPSDEERLTVTLKQAGKVLPQLRKLFPQAFIAGWKYELEGTRADALEKSRKQIATCLTDACVLNGRAAGDGFLFCGKDQSVTPIPDLPSLSRHFITLLSLLK